MFPPMCPSPTKPTVVAEEADMSVSPSIADIDALVT